jgi:recombination protein RecT
MSANPPTNGTTAIAKIDTSKPLALPQLRQACELQLPELVKLYPKSMAHVASRLVRTVITEIQQKPQLAECTGRSILSCVVQAATYNLELGGPLGQSWMVPRKNKDLGGVMEACFQIGYRGMITLVNRNRAVAGGTVGIIRDGDVFSIHRGSHPRIEHDPVRNSTKPILYYYASITYKSGFCDIETMTPEETDAHRKKFSKQGTDYNTGAAKGIWKDNFDSMSLKTVILKLTRRAPIAIDLPPDEDELPESLAARPPAEVGTAALPEHETLDAEFEEAGPGQPPGGSQQQAPPVQQSNGQQPPKAGEQIVGAILSAAFDVNLTWSQTLDQFGLAAGVPMRDGLTPKDLTAPQALELLKLLKAAKEPAAAPVEGIRPADIRSPLDTAVGSSGSSKATSPPASGVDVARPQGTSPGE